MRNGGVRTGGGWSKRWYGWLNELGVSGDDAATREQLRGSRVQRLEVQIGSITAKVRDRELGDCLCHIEVPRLSDAQWATVIDALSEQALYAAQLLAGDMPAEIEAVFRDAGIALLPNTIGELSHSCDCCSEEAGNEVCRPLRAAYLALGEMLNEDPWLLFRLRGRDREQILRDLRERRSRAAVDNGLAVTPSLAQPQIAEEPAIYRTDGSAGEAKVGAVEDFALDQAIDRFWGNAKPLHNFHYYIGQPAIELVALRRLGAPPFNEDSASVYEDLAAIYRQTTQSALLVAFAEEGDSLTGEAESDVDDEAAVDSDDVL